MSKIIPIFVLSLRRDASHKLTGGILQPGFYFLYHTHKKSRNHQRYDFFIYQTNKVINIL